MNENNLEKRLFEIGHHAPLRAVSLVVLEYFHIRGNYVISTDDTLEYLQAKYVGKRLSLTLNDWYLNKYPSERNKNIFK